MGIKDVSIFIDTNVFQMFWSVNNIRNVYLYKIEAPKEYYKLVDFVKNNELQDRVELCIPSIVIMECKQHMYECFKKNVAKIEEDIKSYKKAFDFLLEIDVDIKKTTEDYQKFVEEIFDDFVTNTRNCCKIVPHSKDDKLLEKLLEKALKGTKPFCVGKIGGKEYSDAGFKDSIIAETIYEYCEKNDRIGIFVSHDNDFSEAFSNVLNSTSKFVLFKSYDDAIDALKDFFATDPKKQVKEKFEQDIYLREKILQEAGLKLDASVTDCEVQDVDKVDDVFDMNINLVVNETHYCFNVKFDDIANEILECSYEIEND